MKLNDYNLNTNIYFNKEFATFKLRMNSKVFGSKLYYFVVFGIYFVFLVTVDKHAYAGIYQKCAKNVEHPVEVRNQSRPDKNKRKAHQHSPDYPPEKHLMIKP